MKKTKIEWSAILICELVFGYIGVMFTAVGVVLWVAIDEVAASPGSRGNIYILPWIFCGIGVVFLIVLAVLLSITIRRRKIRKRLMENGDYIRALVTEVRQDTVVKVNNRHPYYVICEGVDPYTGERLTFRSANMMDDPSYLLGQRLRVFLDYGKPKNYHVEVERKYND